MDDMKGLAPLLINTNILELANSVILGVKELFVQKAIIRFISHRFISHTHIESHI